MELKHIINGQPVCLRSLSDKELKALVNTMEMHAERIQEEIESLRGEQIRRSHNVIPLFGSFS